MHAHRKHRNFPGSAASHLPCANLALENPPIGVFFAHIWACFFDELFLTANLGSERSILEKNRNQRSFLLCMRWRKPHSMFGRRNVFLENNSRFGYSWFFIVLLIILDIKCSWRGLRWGVSENYNFSWWGRLQLYYKKNHTWFAFLSSTNEFHTLFLTRTTKTDYSQQKLSIWTLHMRHL